MKRIAFFMLAIAAMLPLSLAKIETMELPDDVRVSSIYMPTTHENMGWFAIKRYSAETLLNVLQSAQAKVNAEKYVDGAWVKVDKKEFIGMLKSGKIKPKTKGPINMGTSKMIRKPVYGGDVIGKCQSIYNPIQKSSISIRDWKRMSPKAQEEILSSPYTKRYLKRCRGACFFIFSSC